MISEYKFIEKYYSICGTKSRPLSSEITPKLIQGRLEKHFFNNFAKKNELIYTTLRTRVQITKKPKIGSLKNPGPNH